MAARFGLRRKRESDLQVSEGFTPLSLVDDEIRENFHEAIAEPEDEFYCFWSDIIGFKLALGHEWPKVFQQLGDTFDLYIDKNELGKALFQLQVIRIAKYIAENFEVSAWR